MWKKEYVEPPKPIFHFGERNSQMSHTRIRVKFSNLNFHLFNYNLIDSPNCQHCDLSETPNHYFLICAQYAQERAEMIDKIRYILQKNNLNDKINLELLVHGSKKLSYISNSKLFNAVHIYIKKTCRNP